MPMPARSAVTRSRSPRRTAYAPGARNGSRVGAEHDIGCAGAVLSPQLLSARASTAMNSGCAVKRLLTILAARESISAHWIRWRPVRTLSA